MGNRGGRDDRGLSRTEIRPARQFAHYGDLLCALGDRLRVCVELDLAAGLPHHWRTGDWRIFRAGADVYRRALASKVAGAAGRIFPSQYRRWHYCGVPLKLSDYSDKPRTSGMALDARNRSASGGPISYVVVLNPA